MTEQELRSLVRQAIALHTSGHAVGLRPPTPATTRDHGHVSHAQFVLAAAPGEACVIEPAVRCNHCGFCKSYGH